MFNSRSRYHQTLIGEENLPAIQVSVCYILIHLENRKGERDLFIFIALCVTSLAFSNCTEELTLNLLLLYCQFGNSNDVTSMNKYEQIVISYLLSVNYRRIILN